MSLFDLAGTVLITVLALVAGSLVVMWVFIVWLEERLSRPDPPPKSKLGDKWAAHQASRYPRRR